MRIYTKTGDDGATGLYGGGRISKSHRRIQAVGDVDELNAQIGWVQTMMADDAFNDKLAQLQRDLFAVGADLASVDHEKGCRTGEALAARLEIWIDKASEELPPLKKFILPGGSPAAAALHLARAICRRAERSAVTLGDKEPVNPQIRIYLNRLSDLLFVWARLENVSAGVEEVAWQ